MSEMDNGLSTILLDKHHLAVGETVTLFCHGFTTTATDWIGLFYSGDVASISNCLEYKQGGNSVGKRGLKWLIANNINFQEAENKCLFKYINGSSGSVKAISQIVHIINTDLQETTSPSGTLNSLFSGQLLEFTITGMEAHNLKRTLFGRPSPYVKVSLRPGRMQRKALRSHHGQIGKTSCQVNTIEPSWRNEVFAFKASIWDILEIEVRNRSTGIKPMFSRFLGKLHFPLRELLTKGRSRTQTFNGQLMKREPSRKVLGTFSLTIKTDRDLPGSRNSRRQASPDSLELGDQNGALVNGTGEEHPESEEDRRPSLNASTPDDDLSFRERTSTVPIPPPRAIAQVYMDQSIAAQSQPDLLGLPYTTHENVLLRKRTGNTSLSISPELTNELNSRLSMPPFVFSSTSLRSFENSPSTSSSYANDMALRAGNGEDNTSHDETDDVSLNEPINRNLNDEMVASSNSEQSNTRSACESPSGTISDTSFGSVQASSEAESNQSSISNIEPESSNVDTGSGLNNQSRSSNSDTIMRELNIEDTSETRGVDAANVSLDNYSEQNSQRITSEDTNADENVTEVSGSVTNDGDISEVNETEELLPDEIIDNTNTRLQSSAIELALASTLESSVDDSFPVQQESSQSTDNVPSNENSLPLTAHQLSQHEVLTGDLPTEEAGDTMVEELSINEVDERTNSGILQENDNHETTTQACSSIANNCSAVFVTETQDSSSTPGPEHSSVGQVEEPDENRINQNSLQHFNSTLTRFGSDFTGDSFMDPESEPDIMNVLSLSNAATSDIIMPTQSTDIEGTSPRRTVATCNLRTLFQIPDSNLATETMDESLGRIQPDGATSGEEVIAEVSFSEDGTTIHRVTGTLENRDGIVSDSSSVLTSGDLDRRSNDVSWPSNNTPVVENTTSSETLVRGVDELDSSQLLDSTPVTNQHEVVSTEDSLSQSARTENFDSAAVNASLISQSSTNDESRRTSISPPIPAINHVRYLRSKNVSIRLSSRTASPLPAVYVVPRDVSDNNDDDFPSNSIEAEPVLPATRLDAPVLFNRDSRLAGGRSLARDVFDAPDGSHEAINVGASTSGASLSEATGVQRSSASAVSHSAAKRRSSSDSSQSGSAKNKKKNKSRNRTSRHGSATERAEAADQSLGQAQSRQRRNEETANRHEETTNRHEETANRDDTETEETNEESSSSPRPASIYVQISDFASDEDHLDEPLPLQWERAVDSYGRVYYIDHENRITTWIRPSAASASETSLNEVNHHRQNLDRRYQSFRRTLSGRRRRRSYDEAANASVDLTISTEASNSNDTSTATPTSRSTTDTPSARAVASRPNETTPSRPTGDNRFLLNSSFVKFLTRPDLFSFLRTSGAAGQYYFSHPEVKDMVKRIKEDPRNYLRFMHDRSLVTFLNGFADTSQPMPRGWEQKTDHSGQIYFVDHNSRSTNFADPRLPFDTTVARNRSRAIETAYGGTRRPPPPGMQRAAAVTNTTASTAHRNQEQRRERMTYNQQIVEFLRQPNIDDVLAAKDSSYANNVALKCSVDKIRRDGQRSLRLLSDNLDLIVLLSLFEDDIVSWLPEPKQQTPAAPDKKRNLHNGHDEQGPSSRKASKPAPYKRDFQAKVKSFHKNIIHKGLGQGPNKIQLVIRREHILEDAFDQLMKHNPKTLQKSKLEVKFSGEEGLDYGGPQREFFFLLSRQLFNPYYGLFEYSAQDTYTLHISAMSSFVDNAHDWYRFSGRIIALVIIHQHLLDAFFTRPFYKLLLKCSCDLRDVEALDALFHQSLGWIMETDITDVSLDLSFTVNEELGGQVNERELLPGGKDIRVTEDNKLGYVEFMSNWRIDRGVSDQRKSILKGFYEIIDYDLVSMFDACELELLISGTADIEVNDWFSHTEYRSGYHPNHKVIRWFWQAVNSFDNEQRLRLLQFVTGTSSVPYEGFAALRGSTGLRKFCIERWGNHTMLPRAHTCFNRLDLPAYQHYNELLEKLTLAVEETSTFGIQ